MLRNAISAETINAIQPALDAQPTNPNELLEWVFMAGVALIILGITWSERNK